MVAISVVFHSTGATGGFFSTTSVGNLSGSLQKMGSGLVGPTCLHTAPSDYLSGLASDCGTVKNGRDGEESASNFPAHWS